ncbi:MAG: hypothetical protein GY862_19995 [Gammaproteobacteria bacterium]|nr:hypothetical protein [Gammaproteobacteria bacterium]
MKAIPTGVIFYGVCQMANEHCSAKEGGAVTAVFLLPANEQVNVCKTCLDYKVKDRDWNIEGAYVPGMKRQFDVAVLDKDNNIVLAAEVKTWAHPTPQWAAKIATQMESRNYLSGIHLFLLVTPKSIYLWRVADGQIVKKSVQEIEAAAHILRVSASLELAQDEFIISEKTEFSNYPFKTAKKHMQLERIAKHLLSDKQFISLLPEDIGKKLLKGTDVFMEYVLPSETKKGDAERTWKNII